VIAFAVHGVNADVRAIADEFAGRGAIAAAPDCSGRSIRGRSRRRRSHEGRSQPRLEKSGRRADLADTLAGLREDRCGTARRSDGPCYGGPMPSSPKRLDYDAGISCHGSQMLDYIGELEGLRARLLHLGRRRPPGARRGAGAYRGLPRA